MAKYGQAASVIRVLGEMTIDHAHELLQEPILRFEAHRAM